jgi:chemotaxis protein methyltransferase CheR
MSTTGQSAPRSAPFVGDDFQDADFARIREVLCASRGFDLGMYKDRCIKRRIAARIRKLGYVGPDAYIERLQGDETEVDALLEALSIHVSQFFRNPSTFFVLEQQVLPALIERVGGSGRDEIRLWSAGCAGGEEPYSLALLLAELAPEGMTVAIEASDVSPAVLERARSGLFESQRLAEVPPGVLERYFQPESGQYRLTEQIRRQVRFFQHDLLSVDPYPRVDLILCRNVLIYFSRAEQDQILRRFAQALLPGGVLVLGRAEALLGESRHHFQADFPVERIYRLVEPGLE